MRILEGLDGPALRGRGTVGRLAFPLPGLIWASLPDRPSPRPGDLWVAGMEPPAEMERSLRLGQGELSLELRLPVATPEVEAKEPMAIPAAERVLGVRTPLSSGTVSLLQKDPFDLVLWTNARSAWTDPERFVRELIALRRAAGPAPLLWAPRVALPGRLALLHALGIDLLDTTEGLLRAAEGHRVWAEGGVDRDVPEAVSREELFRRLLQVEEEYAQEEERVRRFLQGGRLRELVESRLPFEPALGEVLRYADGEGYPFQEEHAPVVGSGVRPYGTKEAQYRPEMERYRRRFLTRYRPPPGKELLLLVPCSKTKPYSRSPSHRRILRAISEDGPSPGIHVVSLTSPLGVVPQELEGVFPAAHYDIPVTGNWDGEERGWVLQALRHLVKVHAYRGILVHLPREEMDWVREALPSGPEVLWTVEGTEGVTSAAALRSLARALRAFREANGPSQVRPMRMVREELASLAGFQFGPDVAERLFPPGVRLQGRPWFQRLVDGKGETLATWKEESGLLRLTVPGGLLVRPRAAHYSVEVRGGVELKGDLFAPGAKGAGGEVRIGDEVLLVRGEEFLGVGEARVPGPWMGQLPRGMVVKVRHRFHGSVEREGDRSEMAAPGAAPDA
jgi:archaeosine synthase